MSLSDESPGTSSGSYSVSSSSSSVENISSTVENGELSVFTFVVPVPTHSAPADLGALFSQPCCTSAHFDPPRPFPSDPFRLDDPFAFHHKYHHRQGGVGGPRGPCPFHNQPNGRHPAVLSDNSYIRLLPRTGDGLLLRSLEKGVLFPVIHWSSKYNENLTHQSQFGPAVVFNQGIYKEIKRVIPPDVWLQRDPVNRSAMLSSASISASLSSVFSSSSSRKSTWLVIGYKSLEKTLDSTLEATWKDWTGIRHIYLNLRSEFEIRKISFLHRVHPQDNLDLFMYLCVMEIGNVEDGNMIWLLDFVQRMRVERMKGFLTVYAQVEQEICSIDDEYAKCVEEERRGAESRDRLHSLLGLGISPLAKRPEVKATSPAPSSSMAAYLASTASEYAAVGALDGDNSEINGNIRFMEKIIEEINQQPIGDYM